MGIIVEAVCMIDVQAPFYNTCLWHKLSSNFEDSRWFTSTFSRHHPVYLPLTETNALCGCAVEDWMCLNISRRADFHALCLKLPNYWLFGMSFISSFFCSLGIWIKMCSCDSLAQFDKLRYFFPHVSLFLKTIQIHMLGHWQSVLMWLLCSPTIMSSI